MGEELTHQTMWNYMGKINSWRKTFIICRSTMLYFQPQI
jgi:hypothetical protein